VNLRWLWLDHFSPNVDLNPVQRRRIRASAFRRYRLQERLLVRFVFQVAAGWFIALLIIEGYFNAMARTYKTMWVPRWILVVTLLAMVLYAWIDFALSVRRPLRRLHDHLVGHGICVSCGYSLEGLKRKGRVCPECGTLTEQRSAGA
jgi:hypothetical protein